MAKHMTTQAHRGAILHFLHDPDTTELEESYQYLADGLLFIKDGLVLELGSYDSLSEKLTADVELHEHEDALLLPGFVDTHIHYPQTEMIAAYGEQLLEWLETYTFPTESKFADITHAEKISKIFLNELLRAGTTTALVFGTVHPNSVEALFIEAQKRNLRIIAGKVMMDRNCPDYLQDTPETGYQESKELIEKWHNNGRIRYAVTPRFAPTSTPEQLEKAGQLLQEYPDVYMHTHLSENKDEIGWVKSLFPECETYLDTYDQAGLLGRRSIFAHCVHLEDKEWDRLAETNSGIAFCPTSNLFLGSGLFPLSRAVEEEINVGLGTDVGGGTSFSMLQTLNEAYKILQLRGEKLSPFKGLYLATLGGAKTLDLEDKIGNFQAGKEADFVVIDKKSTPLISFRMEQCKSLFEELFVLSMLGDDRSIKSTWIMGTKMHSRDH